MTVFLKDGEFGVCSRNIELKEDDNNSFWKMARFLDLENKLREYDLQNLALQGELVGESIQKNPLKIIGQNFYVFDVYDIDKGRYITPDGRRKMMNLFGIDHVPVIHEYFSLHDSGMDMSALIDMANDKSMINDVPREGIVFKSNQLVKNNTFSFKAISNSYLLKNDG